MKRLLISSLLSLIAVYSYSQCDAYFNFEEGAEYEMTHYSAKDKISGKSLSEIISLEDDNGVITAASYIERLAAKAINFIGSVFHLE